MSCNLIASQHFLKPGRLVCRAACLILLISCATIMVAQTASTPAGSVATEARVTQILGFAGVSNNSTGMLSIHDNALQFKKGDADPVQIDIASIQDVFVGSDSKQVGGVPMMLGKAATPYGGGRVISLFSHKMYDTLTLQYIDANGAWHGAIFQLTKGAGAAFKSQLVAKGAHVIQPENKTTAQSTQEAPSGK